MQLHGNVLVSVAFQWFDYCVALDAGPVSRLVELRHSRVENSAARFASVTGRRDERFMSSVTVLQHLGRSD